MATTEVHQAGPAASPLRRDRRPRPTTVAAIVVLVAAVVLAAVISRRDHVGPTAAVVGPNRIPSSAVERETAAIQGEPLYAAALRGAATAAVVAPLTPGFVASADGDPDDLRIVATGPTGTRPLTTADLDAQVLTRLLYVTALRQQLAAHHASPLATEMADGAQQARANAGTDQSGRPIYDSLPAWYRTELATRAADIEALVRVLAGPNTVTPAAVATAYRQQAPLQFTEVCLRSEVVDAASAKSAAAALVADPVAGRNDGCAPLSGWANDVAAAVGQTPAGSTVTVSRLGHTAVLLVSSRSTQPLSAVSGVVRAELLARYTDLVDQTVEAELALDRVTVAAQYGTYESFASDHEVLPPDALAPASASTTSLPGPATTTTTVPGGGHGQFDPFD
ncbi:MAG TPA: hypothetical protein VG435_15750 [Acidimicrobiales bacterium]|nr:hypothetical protein [Acidimicrobiales bacterium]